MLVEGNVYLVKIEGKEEGRRVYQGATKGYQPLLGVNPKMHCWMGYPPMGNEIIGMNVMMSW